MDLLIRSQDRTKLERLNKLSIEGRYVRCILDEPITIDDFDKLCFCVCNDGFSLGAYETEERALKVLDEIQNILKPKLKIVQTDDMSLPIINGEWEKSIREKIKFDTIQLSTYVYEMPKE